MFLRRLVQAAIAESGSAAACPATPSLLAELATDPEDFADLARVLNVDLTTIARAIVAAKPPTIAALVAQLEAQPTSVALEAPASEPQQQQSWGSGEAVGWGRWTRVHGGTRVRRASAPAARPALAVP